ncbi:MAG: DUF927 domain-containing protein [Lachnospiraceae bacterium]|nr:DUF927 domain-containing protein [Lachnospiraceae bacterium]
MTVEQIKSIGDKDALLSCKVLDEIYEESEITIRTELLMKLRARARALQCIGDLNDLIKAYDKREKDIERQRRESEKARRKGGSDGNTTDLQYFDDGHELECGSWTVDYAGVTCPGNYAGERIIACYHPIIIAKTLTNVETGMEKVRLAFRKGGRWREITVDKAKIASANKIVDLANYGVAVTSETAKLLVRFLSDLENLNIQTIETGLSTGKFGWIRDRFMPYDTEIEFDAEQRFQSLYDSLQPCGKYDTWLELMREIRANDRYEPQLYMAGAFASILLKPLNVLPFILNLWGETGKGKTVAIMVAASIWANPAENRYITDPVSTAVAIEQREDVLNNLPIMIDDLSKTRDKYADGFTDLIYMLCGGKGKDRSNTSLGLNRTTTWQNICLTNIERPLATETMRGGAINRILDFEMDEGSIFEDGNRVVSIINKNYGHAGEMFVQIIQGMGVDAIKSMQEGFLAKINSRAAEIGDVKEEKQTIPLSVLLTADKIATDYIFEDGIYLDLNRCVDALKGRNDISENERAYEFIQSDIAINANKFVPEFINGEYVYRGECWGKLYPSDGKTYAAIVVNAFDKICERGNFSRKAFLQWAKRKNLLQFTQGKMTKAVRLTATPVKCVCLELSWQNDGQNAENTPPDGFLRVDGYLQNELPFD